MKSILVTGAGDGGGNNLIRSIFASGYPVHILGSNSDRFTLGQSLAERNFLLPRGDDTERYINALRALIEKEKIDLIIPNNDTEVAVIGKEPQSIGARCLLPSWKTIAACQDKYEMFKILADAAIDTADSKPVRHRSELATIFNELGGEKLWCRPKRGSGSRGAIPVIRPEQADAWIRYWEDMRGYTQDQFMLSEYLPGRDFAFQSLWKDGQLIIAKTVERIDYLFGANMPSGTSSSPRVGKLVNESSVNEACVSAVHAIDPDATGMFCIDVKCRADGSPCITEINIGRFFMITIGMNFVGSFNMAALFLRMAFGEKVDVPSECRYGDIGEEPTWLIRSVDNAPIVITEASLRERYSVYDDG